MSNPVVDPWPEGPARPKAVVLKNAATAEPALQRTVKRTALRIAQPVVVALGVLPATFLLADALNDRLGANPIEAITHRTGDWTIWLLLGALAVTPLRRLTGWNELIRFRRTVGLLAYGYGCVHFLIYILLDREFIFAPGIAVASLGEDLMKRPYITMGFAALVLLTPLALTSTAGWVHRLGGRRWAALHRLIYIAGALAVLHYLWQVKGEQPKPVYHGLVLVLLLLFRVWDGRRWGRRGATPRPARPAADRPPPPLPAPPPDPA